MNLDACVNPLTDGGKMSDIFISYARTNRDRAQALAAALDQRGYSVWWDPPYPSWQDIR